MKLKTKIVIIILEMSLIPLLLVSFIGYSNTKQQIIRNTFSKLDAVAQIQKNRLQGIVQNKLSLLSLFNTSLSLRENLRDFDIQSSPQLQTAMDNQLLGIKAGVPGMKNVFLVNPNGVIVASTDTKLLGNNVSTSDYFKLGIKHNDASILKKDNGTNQVVDYIVGPLTLDGKTLGMVAVVADANDVISVANDYTGLEKTGETLLAQDDGKGNVLFVTPTRFNPGAALSLVVSKSRTDIPSVHAIAGEEKAFDDFVDYREVPVFAATRFVKDTKWGIVVKIDQAEAQSPLKSLRRLFLFFIVLTGIFIIYLGIIISRSITEPIQKLVVSASKIAQGDMSQGVVIASNDEVGTLSRGFNVMADNLRKSYATLEQKVRDRTENLEKANRSTQEGLDNLKIEKDKAEAAKAKDEAYLGSIGEGVVVVDQMGLVVLINQTAEEILGRHDLIGKKYIDEIKMIDKEGKEIPIEKRPICQLLKTCNKATYSDYSYLRKDGIKIPVAITNAPVIVDGKTIGGVDVFRDISNEKEIDKAKTEFVSLASHQLRTPLSAINWYTEMLLTGDAGKLLPQQKKYLDEIYKGNQRMVDLVNALLNVSRIELGTFAIESKPTNIALISKSIIKEMSKQIKNKKIKITESYDSKIPKINSDEKLIRIILQNIISNSLKYTPEKGKVAISLTKKAPNVLIKVMDNGYGIPKVEQSHIFEKLFRAENIREKDTEGTGLGLYLVKSIVDQSGGRIWFESVENKGTTFFVTIPLAGMKKKVGTKALEDIK